MGGGLVVNTYCVDLGVSQHWAGFRLFLDAGQVFGSKGGERGQQLKARACHPWEPEVPSEKRPAANSVQG